RGTQGKVQLTDSDKGVRSLIKFKLRPEDLVKYHQVVVTDLVLVGAAAERFEQEARKNGYPQEHIHRAGFSMEKAVALAHGLARAPQVVLLSPACASFDMYDGMAERGRDFKRLVNDL
ncbi:MAG: UDP-N-acetylmuramoyl-L-alanine--D-glutamate ligase, partial [Selenomonas sp.]|nr:UDP-N-acetylmuramoyl-L-alanine--D-glutamate ligase [Selenomonas sp.]